MERCVDPARLGFVTHALSTHGHTDHFDGESLRAIAAAEDRTEHLHLILTAKEQRAIAAKRQLAGG
jgi:L-ascorbate metabolism protein UlaG (beta-lactamase superfamily)